ncbi:4917_t:CDS:1, partial [Scutellospora calospora]
YHMRKTYLNSQINANIQELDHKEILLIVDYKMCINPQSVYETKPEFYEKYSFTLYSVLIYTKNEDNTIFNISTFNYWSNDI